MSRGRLRAPLVWALLAGVAGCASAGRVGGRTHFLKTGSAEEPGTYLGLPLRSGQILLAEAGNPYSLFFSLATRDYYDFTHAAVLVMEGGEPFVYEMTGEYKPGFDDRVTDGIEGGCRRTPLLEYARAYLYLEVFDPPAGVDGEAVARWAQEQYRRGVPFDPYFDASEHERLFCTEFVALALEAGGAPPVKPVPLRRHPSLQRLLGWLGVPRESGLPAGLLADPARSVAALGQLPSLGAARGYFAAKRELHRRFTRDQRLGNVFALDGAQLSLRRQLVVFLEGAVNLIHEADDDPDAGEIDRRVQELAARLFGAAPEHAALEEQSPKEGS